VGWTFSRPGSTGGASAGWSPERRSSPADQCRDGAGPASTRLLLLLAF
jgi:hypothetical protein